MRKKHPLTDRLIYSFIHDRHTASSPHIDSRTLEHSYDEWPCVVICEILMAQANGVTWDECNLDECGWLSLCIASWRHLLTSISQTELSGLLIIKRESIHLYRLSQRHSQRSNCDLFSFFDYISSLFCFCVVDWWRQIKNQFAPKWNWKREREPLLIVYPVERLDASRVFAKKCKWELMASSTKNGQISWFISFHFSHTQKHTAVLSNIQMASYRPSPITSFQLFAKL